MITVMIIAATAVDGNPDVVAASLDLSSFKRRC